MLDAVMFCFPLGMSFCFSRGGYLGFIHLMMEFACYYTRQLPAEHYGLSIQNTGLRSIPSYNHEQMPSTRPEDLWRRKCQREAELLNCWIILRRTVNYAGFLRVL